MTDDLAPVWANLVTGSLGVLVLIGVAEFLGIALWPVGVGGLSVVFVAVTKLLYPEKYAHGLETALSPVPGIEASTRTGDGVEPTDELKA